jgi:ABC-type Mn2+/Zn2+ transport system ATPase subunit
MANAASLPLGHTPSRTDRLRAEEALNRFDSSVIANQLFRSLSGGQQQRVLLARAISTDPDVLVLDEPAEGMDLLGTHDTLDILKGLTATQRMSVLMINHRLDDVIGSVDHLCLINQYNGLFESGPVEVMSDSSKLTSLFGRAVETYNCAGKKHVHVVGV